MAPFPAQHGLASWWLQGPSLSVCFMLAKPCLPQGLALCLGVMGFYSNQRPWPGGTLSTAWRQAPTGGQLSQSSPETMSS